MKRTATGAAAIAGAFAAAHAEGRAALMPYFTAGYPDPDTSEAVFRAIAAAGADLIEIGVPFSDPLADGPTIQHSTQVALDQGMTAGKALQLVARLRQSGVPQPLILMGYANPILAYGMERYVEVAAAAGADGLIVPDLPPEEAGGLLDELKIQYSFVYVDLLESAENTVVKDNIRQWNPRCSFPTLVINDHECIVGFDEEKIRGLVK